MAVKLIISIVIAVAGLTVILLSGKTKDETVSQTPLFPVAQETRVPAAQKPLLVPKETPVDSMSEPISRPSMIPEPEQIPAPASQGPLVKMFGYSFKVNDIVRSNISSLNLRNEDCDKIGTIDSSASMQILDTTTRFCILNDKLFRMWYVKITNSGQVGWLAGFFLEKIPEETIPAETEDKNFSPTVKSFTPPAETNGISQLSAPQAELWDRFRQIFPQTTPYPSQLSPNQSSLWEMYQQMFTPTTSKAPASEEESIPPEQPPSKDNSFGGLVIGRQECVDPPRNYAIAVLDKSGGTKRFIWKMCESQLEEFLGILETVPCGIPETGMYILGELGGDTGCKGGGGSARMIMKAGIDK